MISEHSTDNRNPWIACPRPNPRAGLRLFCFPYSGAAASVFFPWADGLQPGIEVCPVQYPGRGPRVSEPPFTRLSYLIREAAQALRPYLDRPFVFFGHSLGALVSFELARYLDSHYGLSPVQLFISGHNAPQLPNPESPIHKLPEREFVESLRQLNGMADDILGNTELMQLLIPILRADFEACETYEYQAAEPLSCPISAFGGLRDRYVSREGLEAWREETTGPFSLRMFPGDHFYINTDRPILLQAVARDINPFLELILG